MLPVSHCTHITRYQAAELYVSNKRGLVNGWFTIGVKLHGSVRRRHLKTWFAQTG